MFLLLDVLLNDAELCTAGGAHTIRVRPQGWQFPCERRKFLAQQTRRTPFDQFHQPMHAKLGSTLSAPLHMIGHDFQFLDLCLMFLANLPDDFSQAGFEGLPPSPSSAISDTKPQGSGKGRRRSGCFCRTRSYVPVYSSLLSTVKSTYSLM
jgi:hypothetical protein